MPVVVKLLKMKQSAIWRRLTKEFKQNSKTNFKISSTFTFLALPQQSKFSVNLEIKPILNLLKYIIIQHSDLMSHLTTS